mgnify:FL=1
MVKRMINNKTVCTEEFRDLYPFESNFARVNGFDMHYVDEGAGKPVIMVHGNPTWSFYYRRIIQALSDGDRKSVV